MSASARPGTAPPGLDLDALTRYLDGVVAGGLSGPLCARLIEGGRSNLTYEVGDGRHRWVLRRPPLGHVLETAHDMGREYRVIDALRDTVVPVPRVVDLCTDQAVVGAPFYLMEFVDGVLYRSDDDFERLNPAEASALAYGLVDVLADLHLVDHERAGLGDFGRPEGYLERQVRRWGRQLAASRSRDLDGIDELAARLAAEVPRSQRACVVHGDYRQDNVIVAAGSPGRILAVLDWEMATVGDPLTDVGMFAMYWDGLAGMGNPVINTPGDHAGFPPRDELVARYATRTGLDLSDLHWYFGFAFFKIAVILEGINYRFVNGLTVGDGFDKVGATVPAFVERGLAALGT